MKLKIGLKFKEYYNEGNINNKPCHEVRAIVDDKVLVLLSTNKGGEKYYSMIDIGQFLFYEKKGHYLPIEPSATTSKTT